MRIDSVTSSQPEFRCDHHEAGPFTVKAFKGGTYRVCTEAGACAEVFAERNL